MKKLPYYMCSKCGEKEGVKLKKLRTIKVSFERTKTFPYGRLLRKVGLLCNNCLRKMMTEYNLVEEYK